MTNLIEDAVNQANTNYFSQANSEANLERRAKEIERIADESMLEGGEFYPWSEKNFDEAINQEFKGVIDGAAVRWVVRKYWKKCALFQVEKNYKD